ncbi:hypothetical protein DMN50_02515 [Priestia megaterium]|nr:hypothetical protein DMN50_02515 [Priestia megaterium]
MSIYEDKEGLFKASSDWSKHCRYEIEGELIVPKEGPLKRYNPLDYYKNPLTIEMVEEIFGKKKKRNTDMFIHTSFASLDVTNEQEILNWVNTFGLPFVPFLKVDDKERKQIYESKKNVFFPHDIKNLYRKTQEFTLPRPNISRNPLLKEGIIWETEGIYIEEVKEEIRRVKYILELKEAKDKSDFSSLSKTALEIVSYWQLYTPEYQQNIAQDLIFSAATDHYIVDTFNMALRNVRPLIFFENGEGEWGWHFDALLAAIYIMFSIDMTESKIPQKCKYVNCNTYFKATTEANVYCSTQCQDNAKTYRAREKKKRESRKLWQVGKTAEEIIVLINVEPYRLKGWINKWEAENGRKY